MKDEILDKLGDALSDVISKSFTLDRLLLLLIEDKAKNLGVSLTRSQKKKLTALLQKEDFESVSIQPNPKQKAQLKNLGYEDISLEISEADIATLEAKIVEVIKDTSKSTLEHLISSSSTKLVKEWKKQANPILRKLRNERQKFNNYNNKIWGKSLSLLETFIDISLDTGILFDRKFRPLAIEENDIAFDALTRLHARSCQVSSEILTLLRNGFADGAHARWRTLHEISVTALFISHHNKELAERYLAHSIVADYRRAVEYRKYSDSLSYTSMSDETFNQLKASYEAALDKYGANFKNDYGWASVILNKDKPNFSDIEEKAGVLHMRPFVKLAHMNIHAGSTGIIFRLGSPPDNPNLLLAGSSIYGIGEPAQNTAYSLEILTEAFLLRKPNIENSGFVLAFRELMQEVIWEFDKVMEKQEHENHQVNARRNN
ncbi:MAG: hypothetical protein HYZ24_11890 [Chloroflexi bacterium]|nr:hypothetical protein [Chloroflexota bacterium]